MYTGSVTICVVRCHLYWYSVSVAVHTRNILKYPVCKERVWLLLLIKLTDSFQCLEVTYSLLCQQTVSVICLNSLTRYHVHRAEGLNLTFSSVLEPGILKAWMNSISSSKTSSYSWFFSLVLSLSRAPNRNTADDICSSSHLRCS